MSTGAMPVNAKNAATNGWIDKKSNESKTLIKSPIVVAFSSVALLWQ